MSKKKKGDSIWGPPDMSKLTYRTKKGAEVLLFGMEERAGPKGQEWWCSVKNIATNEVVECKYQIFLNSISNG